MATTTQKKRSLKYLNKDFQGFKRDLSQYLKEYFPDNYEDFNESSIGMLLSEMCAYIGDNLSFYMDKKFDESFIQNTKERKNLFKHAKQLGFKAFGKTSAFGKVDAFIEVPSITTNQKIQPDMRYAGTIKKGAKLRNSAGKIFETLEDIDFSQVDTSDSNFVRVSSTDSTTGQPSGFALRVKDIEVKAGETKTTTFSAGAYEPFPKFTIPDEDVLEIIEIRDSENNVWYEVDYLAQDTVFDSFKNSSSDNSEVPYVLKLKSVPFRFISEFDTDTKKTSIIFGTGDSNVFDGDLIPDLGDLSLPAYGKDSFSDFSIDPQNFLRTRTLGLCPVNTTLTVKYRVGGGIDTNTGAMDLNNVSSATFDVGDSSLDQSIVRNISNTFSVQNVLPIQGGKEELSLEEIRALISANFASQSRIVTAEDYIARTLSMPARFGSIFRAATKPGQINKNSIEVVVLSQNSSGQVVIAPQTLKENLKKYLDRFRLATSAIEILDGEIINIGINFGVLVDSAYNKSEVLSNCINSLSDFFKIEKWQMLQPINLTDLFSLLAQVDGVVSVFNLEIVNYAHSFEGRTYSSTAYDITSNTKNGIVYCKENSIFEILYPNKDIRGVAR